MNNVFCGVSLQGIVRQLQADLSIFCIFHDLARLPGSLDELGRAVDQHLC